MMARVARFSGPAPREDHFVHLLRTSWSDYVRMLEVRGEHAVPRITFLEGTLEIMTPSLDHEMIKSTIGRLVEVYCDEHGIDFSPCGSWTLKSQRRKAGAEPDECYIFGELPGRPRVPDLAIEVEWTSGRIDKLGVYLKLGVREVWYWRAGRIEPYELVGGRYVLRKKSRAVPGVDLALLASFLTRPGPTSAIARAYRAALRSLGSG